MSKEKSKIPNVFFQDIFCGLVAEGRIDPQNKSDEVLKKEFIQYLRSKVFAHGTLYAITEHGQHLLTHARKFLKQKHHELACLLYATWFEHWINNLIVVRSRLKSITSDKVKFIIRGTNFRVKYICLVQLFDLPPFSKKYVDTVIRINELRNGFVHYKFEPKDVDKWTYDDKVWRQDFEKVEKAVRYFQGYERKHIYKKSKQRVRRLMKTKS